MFKANARYAHVRDNGARRLDLAHRTENRKRRKKGKQEKIVERNRSLTSLKKKTLSHGERKAIVSIARSIEKRLAAPKDCKEFHYSKSSIIVELSQLLGSIMDYNIYVQTIPALKFDPSWEVRIVPPYMGAMVRFLVKNSAGQGVSVYLDCHNVLGNAVGPYWEIYPYQGDTHRVSMDDTDELMRSIRYALEHTK